MARLELDVNQWAQEQFGDCELGDARRTKRAVTLAAQAAAFPDGSTPAQTESWTDCKAAYRLFEEDDVLLESLCEPHWRSTRSQTEGLSLAEVARKLGIHANLLRIWKDKAAGGNPSPSPSQPTAVEVENARLRAENERLRMERDILKKATAFFAKESR